MAAAPSKHDGDDSISGAPSSAHARIRRIGFTCRSAVDGRRAIRALGEWSGRFELSEPEFQVLWCLRAGPGEGCDQTTIARYLACSPAQVSTTVERMRSGGWITPRNAPGDRRRHLWQLSTSGRELLAEMLSAADQLRYPAVESDERSCVPNQAKGAA